MHKVDALPVIYTGETLKNAVFETREVRESLIESLIPKKSTTMFFAPDGVGKSTLILQKILEASSGTDVFGGLKSKPINTILLLTERPKEEVFERIQYMSKVITINWDGVILDDEVRGMDLISGMDYAAFLERVLFLSKQFEGRGGTDYVFIDTLYGTVAEGLANEKACGQVNKLLRRIQAVLGCACGYTHHTNRGQRNKKSGVREAEDMYGNRSLSANCTGVYHITKTDSGTLLTKKKDSLECLADRIDLTFDKETYVSLIREDQSSKYTYELVEGFIKDSYKLKRDFHFHQIQTATRVSTSYLRARLSGYLKAEKIVNLKPLGEKALYRVITP